MEIEEPQPRWPWQEALQKASRGLTFAAPLFLLPNCKALPPILPGRTCLWEVPKTGSDGSRGTVLEKI